ncbi:MAG: TlpA disulfide reductase family protein [Pseudomonadota bacterium]
MKKCLARRISIVLVSLVFVSAFFQAFALAAEVGEESPEFQFRTLDGVHVRFCDLKGEKPVFLVFWATWCRSCKEEVPAINELYEKFASKGMEFLAVGVGINDSETRVKKFASKHNLSYPVAFDPDGMESKKFGVLGTPTILVIDKGGVIRYRASIVPEDLERHFSSLMGS